MSSNSETQETPRRVALVTGCGMQDGIGSASARALAKAGVSVMVTDVTSSGVSGLPSGSGAAPSVGGVEGAGSDWRGIDSLVDEIRASGGIAEATTGDISKEDDANRMVEETYEKFGSVDILVNNASAPQFFADIEELPLHEWERIFSINSRGTYLMSKAAIKYMRQRQWGRIINIASMNTEIGSPRASAHAASKAAVVGFTRTLATEVGPQGITVMAVNPVLVLTTRGRLAAQRLNADDPEAGAAHIPVRRFSTTDDIAAVVEFLASEKAGYLSGEVIRVTGGGISWG